MEWFEGLSSRRGLDEPRSLTPQGHIGPRCRLDVVQVRAPRTKDLLSHGEVDGCVLQAYKDLVLDVMVPTSRHLC